MVIDDAYTVKPKKCTCVVEPIYLWTIGNNIVKQHDDWDFINETKYEHAKQLLENAKNDNEVFYAKTLLGEIASYKDAKDLLKR